MPHQMKCIGNDHRDTRRVLPTLDNWEQIKANCNKVRGHRDFIVPMSSFVYIMN